MFTAKQMMNNECSFNKYQQQFVNDRMINYVVSCIGSKKIMRSTDSHFNDIPLRFWNRINIVPFLDIPLFKKCHNATYSKETH